VKLDMAAPQTPDNLTTIVRNYVHYDNLAKNYANQATGARKLRDEFEHKIITSLRTNNMENAIIQISGASLQCVEEKTAPTMTLPRLEGYLHKYFQQKGNGMDETDAILRFLKLQKMNDTQTTICLKKTPMATPIPPPPPVGQFGLK
jgi:hypothetical protein